MLRQRIRISVACPGRAAVRDAVLQRLGLFRVDEQGGSFRGGDVVDQRLAQRDSSLAKQSAVRRVGAGIALPDGRVEYNGIRPLGSRRAPDMSPLCISVGRARY
ncbi:hypothetical protein [Streptomyces coerulescens]|uniref:Uncharacterized protein n=1 Tax=Streptomyces coerulescens TaxID=29304 RepID=A0ABW0CSM1_STRCD